MVFAPIILGTRALPQAKTATSVADAQQALLKFSVSDDMATEVPVVLQKAVSSFKKALSSQTDAVIAGLAVTASAASVQRKLLAAMPASTVGKLSNEQWRKLGNDGSKQPVAGLYGGELTLSVSKPKPTILLVQESFAIACGNDTVLLAYSDREGAWKQELLWQSKPYRNVSGAYGDAYETLLLKPELDGHPLLLVVHGTPWCTSTMSAFSMDILELGADRADQLLWHGVHGYRRADEDPPLTVRATLSGFEVRTSVSAGGDRVSRKGVMRYAVSAAGVHRVEPLAMNAGDSLSEWFELPRKEAADFADGPADSLTWRMFEDFTYEEKGKNATVLYPAIQSVRACTDSPTHFQAKVTSEIVDSSAKGSNPGPTYFVQMQQVTDGYRIHAVTHATDQACHGPNLMGGS